MNNDNQLCVYTQVHTCAHTFEIIYLNLLTSYVDTVCVCVYKISQCYWKSFEGQIKEMKWEIQKQILAQSCVL